MGRPPRCLNKLFRAALTDIYYAEKEILGALPVIAKAVQSHALRLALEKRHADTAQHVARLEQVFEIIEIELPTKANTVTRSLLQEGEAIIRDYEGAPALDAGLVAAVQAVAHYEISRYGTLHTWAEVLGFAQAAKLLDETLREEEATERVLTELAVAAVLADPE